MRRHGQNVVRIGAPGSGKTLATARSGVESDGAEVDFDPAKESFAQEVLTHAKGNLLYAKLSDLRHTLGFELGKPSTHADPVMRQQENHLQAEALADILLYRRQATGMATTPLMEEWVMAAIMLVLFQRTAKPITWLPFAFMPGTEQFAALVRDCELKEISHKFKQLEGLKPRALRAEVGSAMRLINSVFRSLVFAAWSMGGFDLGAFLDKGGKLVIERGDEIGQDTMRTIMGMILLLVIEHAKRRPSALPTIRVRIDEAANAGLLGHTELKAAAEHNKRGLYFEFILQKAPSQLEDLLQICHRHEWYCCPNYELARKAAVDIVAGLKIGDESRPQRIAKITDEIMNLDPGWRWVRDQKGSRKEYVPLLENPWPDWPGLRESKFQEKLQWIYARPEYGGRDTPPSSISSNDTPPRPTSSPVDSSPAERWRRGKRKPADGSSSSDAGGESR
jgi:hypothetical protein